MTFLKSACVCVCVFWLLCVKAVSYLPSNPQHQQRNLAYTLENNMALSIYERDRQTGGHIGMDAYMLNINKFNMTDASMMIIEPSASP